MSAKSLADLQTEYIPLLDSLVCSNGHFLQHHNHEAVLLGCLEEASLLAGHVWRTALPVARLADPSGRGL